MLEKETRKKIFRKLEAMEEGLNYDIESLVGLKADIQTIYFFLYLLEKEEQNEA